MSVLIPSDQLTLTEKARLRQQAVNGGIKRAMDLGIRPSKDELAYRQCQNIADFLTVGREEWLTANLAVVNTQYSVWTTLAAPAVGLTPVLGVNKVAVFWAAAVNTVPNPVSLLSFRVGATATSTLATFNLEDCEAQLAMEGYFSEPVVFDQQQTLNVVVTCKIATLIQARVCLSCYIIEPRGDNIS